jgi:hypothetical protein
LTNKTVDGVSPATMAFLDATSSVQGQLNAKQAALTLPLSVANGGSGAATAPPTVSSATSPARRRRRGSRRRQHSVRQILPVSRPSIRTQAVRRLTYPARQPFRMV